MTTSAHANVLKHSTAAEEDDRYHEVETHLAIQWEESELLSVTPVAKTEASDDSKQDDYLSEAEDKVPALPQGWPKIPQIFQQKSWNFSTAVSPSVEKATSHLEMLQKVIEEWSRDAHTRANSQTSSCFGKGKGSSRKQLTFDKSATQDSIGHSTESRSTRLSIEGIGATFDGDETKRATEPDFGIPYLGADEVIEEVITLLAKLENDRQETTERLHQEREKVTRLGAKIDSLSVQRMMELPRVVQKEHEACAMDILELNWHLSSRGRTQARIQSKTSVAEALNQRLKEDISFVQKHIPLVQEKLDLEQEAMEKIRQAQLETDEEVEMTRNRLAKVETKSKEALTKADQERQVLKSELYNVRQELASVNDALADARNTYTMYVQLCHDYRNTTEENTEEIKVQAVKEESAKAMEAMHIAKVKDLQERIKESEFEHKKLDDELNRQVTKFEENHATFTENIGSREKDIENKSEKVRQLTRKNKEHDMDIEDLKKKILNCVKQRQADKRNMERMQKELVRNEEQTNEAVADLSNVYIVNRATREHLENEEENCIQAEEMLRATVDALKKQLKEELHTKTVLDARIKSDSSDCENYQIEAVQKRQMLTKKGEEVRNAVTAIQIKVEKLRSMHKDKAENIEKCNAEIQRNTDAQKQVGDAATARIQELQPKRDSLKDAVLAQEKQMDQILWRLDMMEKKIKEMSEQAGMMTRSMAKTQTLSDSLQLDKEELDIQIESGQRLLDDLESALKETSSRLEALDRDYKHEKKERSQVSENLQDDLSKNLKLNKQLAAYYRQLQNELIEVKNTMLNKFDGRVNAEQAIKDIKQLQALQKHMQHALREYFKYRGMFNQSNLSRIETESLQNGVRVAELQTEMDSALDTITGFLQHQVDGATIRRAAMEKVDREERDQQKLAHQQARKSSLQPAVADNQSVAAVGPAVRRQPVTLAEVAS